MFGTTPNTRDDERALYNFSGLEKDTQARLNAIDQLTEMQVHVMALMKIEEVIGDDGRHDPAHRAILRRNHRDALAQFGAGSCGFESDESGSDGD